MSSVGPWGRLRGGLRRRPGGRLPSGGDVALAGAAVLVGQVVEWKGLIGAQPQHGGAAYNAAVSALVLGALAWRRVAPLGSVVWCAALFCFLQPFAPHDLPVWTGFVPLVVLTVGAGYRADRRAARAALAVCLAGLTVLTAQEPVLRSWDTYIFNAAIVVPAWGGARVLAERSDRARHLADDLHSLEAAQSARERRVLAEERARIARELHDVVAHSVTVLMIQVGSARVLLDRSPERARAQLLAAEGSGREALEELRRLLDVLRPDLTGAGGPLPTAPQPGLDQLPALVTSFTEAGMRLSLHCTGDWDAVGPGLSLTAYRVVQEGLTNALKHAPGADVRARVEVLADLVRIVIDDDAPATTAGFGTGHGLIGLRERVAVFGGSYEAGPRPGGWTVRVSLPRPAVAAVAARQS